MSDIEFDYDELTEETVGAFVREADPNRLEEIYALGTLLAEYADDEIQHREEHQ